MHKRISGILISIILVFALNSNVIARKISLHSSLLGTSFTSAARTFTGKDVAKLFEAYNAGENYSVYGVQRALFFTDDHGNIYVVAIHEKSNTLMASKINEDNMIKLNAALKNGFDSKIIAKLQKDDPAFALVFQPTAHLARSKSYAGFAEEVIERDFPTLEQLNNDYGKNHVQTTEIYAENDPQRSNNLSGAGNSKNGEPGVTSVTSTSEPSEQEMLSAIQGVLDEADQQANEMTSQCNDIRENSNPYAALSCMLGTVKKEARRSISITGFEKVGCAKARATGYICDYRIKIIAPTVPNIWSPVETKRFVKTKSGWSLAN